MATRCPIPPVRLQRDCVEVEMLLIRSVACALVAAMLALMTYQARAETLESALIKAYGNNPQLNAQRANVRATDEGVSKAQSGYRPKLTASSNLGYENFNYRQPNPRFGTSPAEVRTIISDQRIVPRGFSAQLTQNIYDSGATSNSVRQ